MKQTKPKLLSMTVGDRHQHGGHDSKDDYNIFLS